MTEPVGVVARLRSAVEGARFDRNEIAGGLGDAGLMIPIAIALIAINGLGATAVFCGVGLVYVATALYYRVPVPVQPLKAFAAAAIALGLDAQTLAAGALLMAAALALLASTGLADWLAARFPVVLVRGIQASVALLLVKAAVDLAERGNWDGMRAVDPAVGVITALVACAVLLLCSRSRRLPGSLIVLAAGAGIGIAIGNLPSHLALGPAGVSASIPDGGAFATALTAMVLAQIPLTFGNSVVATADAERTYFGERAARVTPRHLATSITAANVLAGFTSGLPVCHGAGGATAHYRMGARTAGATLSVGILYLALGLLLGRSLPSAMLILAPGALAGMLLYVAIEHGLLAARLERASERLLAGGVGVVTLLSGNLAIGFGAGAAVLLTAAGWRRVVSSGGRSVLGAAGIDSSLGSAIRAPGKEAVR